MRRLLCGVAVSVLLAATATAQQGGPSGQAAADYLGRTPVSLLDWGMLRLERDLTAVVQTAFPGSNRAGPVRVGAFYRPFDRRVLAYVSLALPERQRTEAQCRELFTAVREQLLAGAPGGAEGPHWYLKRVFGSDVRRSEPLPDDFAAGLLDLVLLEVTLRVPPGEAFDKGPGKLACAGRLDAETAQLVPPPRPQG